MAVLGPPMTVHLNTRPAVRTCRDAARVTYMSQPRVSVLSLQPGTLCLPLQLGPSVWPCPSSSASMDQRTNEEQENALFSIISRTRLPSLLPMAVTTRDFGRSLGCHHGNARCASRLQSRPTRRRMNLCALDYATPTGPRHSSEILPRQRHGRPVISICGGGRAGVLLLQSST